MHKTVLDICRFDSDIRFRYNSVPKIKAKKKRRENYGKKTYGNKNNHHNKGQCLDVVSSEPFNKVVTLPRTYKDDKALMKKVQEVVDDEEVKAVHVVDTVSYTHLTLPTICSV